MEPQRRRHLLAKIPTIAILALFALSWPLGVLFFILRAIDRDSMKKEGTEQFYTYEPTRRTDSTVGVSSQKAQAETSEAFPDSGIDHPTQEQKNAKNWHHTITVLCTILGAVFLFTGAIDLVDVLGEWFYFPDFEELFTALTMTLGGGGALLMGLRMNRTRKLEKLLDTIVGERDSVPLDELFAAAGVSAKKGLPALENAIEHGHFGADAYIDHRTGTLVVRGAAPQPPETPQPKPLDPNDPYSALLQQLRQVNASIPDPVMTAKISRLEELSARIFALAQKDPGKKAQLQKFMDYYLPTALKLLNTYAQLSAQEVQGSNITEARQNIERSMDLLISAFENQLDKLFQADALDVSTDIAALEGMLSMDGLTNGDFSSGR